ncbi:aromatic ring-hydroxylating dioxygenase subunit alpha [Pseudomaricurvus sp. HS19]|uniref:aromatic ring-hydroxylating oxygenase subunit alpha n=1 Tax=Pseudomaricurvus sp. HS19 TaxID=2692626 RepID=UPI00136C5F7F|nr:aromatic ring-hydroxylating dioxygenase subunit alpha [Pseudomaricurvus sp. HS19]MYM64567.1 Rieske 2Fe-2S domain-containing protein [Pseudomaricurvus sp. HS19]
MTAELPVFEPVTKEEASRIGTAPVPAGPYYQSDYFDAECEAVFRRSWLNVGHTCELPEPGDYIVRELEVANASLLITRNRDGLLKAFHNACTHRGTQLVSEPCGRRQVFSCPYHMWTFNSDGELRNAPDFDQFYVDKAELNLKPVAVDSCGGMLFINLNPNPAQSLRDYLGPLADQLETLPSARATTFSEYVYEIDANWKLTYDNFQENYHLRFIHPKTGAATSGKDNPFGYPLRYGFHDPHRTQTIWSNPQPQIQPFQMLAFGKGMQFAMQDGLVGSEQSKEYYAVFPNLFILGSPMQPFSHTVYPISATKSRGVIRIYWVGEDDCASRRFAREYAMGLARDIHSEDRAVIEAGQRGLNSGALTHIHFQAQEVLCRHLFNMVDERVQAYRAERQTGGAQ